MRRNLSHLSLSYTFTGSRAWFSFSHLEEPSYDVPLALARQKKACSQSVPLSFPKYRSSLSMNYHQPRRISILHHIFL